MRSWPLILILAAIPSYAQVAKWQLGGSGMAWDQRDSLQVLVDFADGAIQPLYLQPQQNVIHLLDNWQFWRDPSLHDLGYVDGQKPRFWNRWNGVGGDPTQSGVFLVDRDSTTYNAPRSQSIASTFFSPSTLPCRIPPCRLRLLHALAGLPLRRHPPALRHQSRPSMSRSARTLNRPFNWGGNDLCSKKPSPMSVPTLNPSVQHRIPAPVRPLLPLAVGQIVAGRRGSPQHLPRLRRPRQPSHRAQRLNRRI